MRGLPLGVAFAFIVTTANSQGWQDGLNARPDGPTVQCWISDEDMAGASRALFMRGMALSDYDGHLAKEWQFTQSSDNAVFVHGTPVEPLYSDPAASLVVISMVDALHARATGSGGPMGDLAAQFAPMLATLMGLETRAFIIDFAEPSVTMVTHEGNGSRITDMVRTDCL